MRVFEYRDHRRKYGSLTREAPLGSDTAEIERVPIKASMTNSSPISYLLPIEELGSRHGASGRTSLVAGESPAGLSGSSDDAI